MKHILFLFLAASFFNLSGQAIDTEKSVVNFTVKNFKFKKVSGTFEGFQGNVNFNSNNVSSAFFNVCIDAATINTENEERDAHLKNEDFFNVETYPQICFESSEVVKNGKNYTANGVLIMHGEKKETSIDFEYDPKTNMFTGDLTINRLDFNVGADTNTFLVSDEVKISITCALF